MLITGLNLLGAKTIGRAENWIVGLKIAILLLFIIVGIPGAQPERMAVGTWVSPFSLVSGGMIIFVAYEGFELIANTTQEVRKPAETLPRTYFTAVCFVLALYVLIAIVTVGNLAQLKIVAAKDYSLAEAARPFMGQAGFTLIAIAALASAINATLYGAARLTYIITKDGELPGVLEKKVWNQPLEGLLLTAAVTLLLANLLDLSSISTIGSAGFLLVFAAVNAANAKLSKQTGSRSWISVAGGVACGAALGALL